MPETRFRFQQLFVASTLMVLCAIGSTQPAFAQAALLPCDRMGPGPVFGRQQGPFGEPITAMEWVGAVPGDEDNGGWEIPNAILTDIFGPRLIPVGPESNSDPQQWVVLVNGALKLRTLVISNEFQPRPLDTPGLPPMFAPYWNDADTTDNGTVFICAMTDGDPRVVTPGNAIVVTWDGVEARDFDGDSDPGTATFQLIVRAAASPCATDSETRRVEVEFRYELLEWQTVEDFLDREFTSRGGYTDSLRDSVELPGSGTNPAKRFIDDSNVERPGVYVFEFSRPEPTCGDGATEGCEVCDDGNMNNEDNCTNQCTANACGDGFVDRQGPELEICDGASFLNEATCPEGFSGTPLCNNDPANLTTFDDTCTFTTGGCTAIPRCNDGSLPPCTPDAGVPDASLPLSDVPRVDRVQARGGCTIGSGPTPQRSSMYCLVAAGLLAAARRRR